VAGGWATDLWLGRETRHHEDLEITIPEGEWASVLARLEVLGLELYQPGGGQIVRLTPGVTPAFDPERHQCWAADPVAGEWRIDVFREPGDRDTWIYRRKSGLSAPRSFANLVSAAGLPIVAPQVQLFFKAKATRDKDQADFDHVAPTLEPAQRAWLGEALQRYEPGHRWIEALEGDTRAGPG
jgi:hypothetical protein